ncbi:MAG: FecR domain-containing protein [Chitinophagaceae bacterium]|nr:FecR domain-containing protein [Chitinophagaceae bacterium]
MMDRLGELFKLYYNKTASPQEREELMGLLRVASSSDLATLANLIRESGEKLEIVESGLPAEKANSILATILGKSTLHAGLSSEGGQASVELQPTETLPKIHRLHFRRARWWAAAAILVLGISSYFLILNKQVTSIRNPIANNLPKDLPPGREAATLTLNDGRQILLDSTTGTITDANGIQIINVDGLLSYQGEATGDQVVLYNTITTARGNQYQLQLEDGSKVWLNSASSLRYPVAFKGNDREVELTGEGYFEVAHNPTMSFKVKTHKQVVEVLGTHFNINSYNDENAVRTTLFEGSVRVQSGVGNQESVVIKPGQQSILTSDQQLITSNKVDLEKIIAWKNGWFEFDQVDIGTIMRQVSRWYDVDIEIKGKGSKEKFGGRLSRNLPLSAVIEMMKVNGVECELDGKSLVVRL